MRIARSGLQIDRHQELTGLAVVLVQTRFPFSVTGAVVAGDHPDISFVVERHIMQPGLLLRAHADQNFGNPRCGIDA